MWLINQPSSRRRFSPCLSLSRSSFLYFTPQALHIVRGPSGPLLHWGVTIVPQRRQEICLPFPKPDTVKVRMMDTVIRKSGPSQEWYANQADGGGNELCSKMPAWELLRRWTDLIQGEYPHLRQHCLCECCAGRRPLLHVIPLPPQTCQTPLCFQSDGWSNWASRTGWALSCSQAGACLVWDP